MTGLVPSRCRSCGADIWWGRTPDRKRIPVNAEPTVDGNVIWVGSEGMDHVVVVRKPHEGETAYVAHFATCPNADSWRGKR